MLVFKETLLQCGLKDLDLEFLKNLHARATLPWVCLGDFNEILHFTKKQGHLPKPLALMLAFKETLL